MIIFCKLKDELDKQHKTIVSGFLSAMAYTTDFLCSMREMLADFYIVQAPKTWGWNKNKIGNDI